MRRVLERVAVVQQTLLTTYKSPRYLPMIVHAREMMSRLGESPSPRAMQAMLTQITALCLTALEGLELETCTDTVQEK